MGFIDRRERDNGKQDNRNFILMTIFLIAIIAIGYTANKKPSDSGPIGKAVSYSDYSEHCKNYTLVRYVCSNGAIVDNTANCFSSIVTISGTATTIATKTNANKFSVRRCISGRCVEVEISKEFDFLYSECTVDNDCYDIVCHRKTTTATT
ncbi:MAG: hypothetical protein QW802_04640 [Candidatus Altiarchaeota archaeon]